MKKRIFFCGIPLQVPQKIKYRKEAKGEIYSDETGFPSIVMLDWNLTGNEEVKIVTIRTEDDGLGRTEAAYEEFKKELQTLSKDLNIPLEINTEIILPRNESKEKHVEFFRKLSNQFDDEAEIHMDVTYGTKGTAIASFASLTYAEKAKKCEIKTIAYGSYNHDGSNTGNYYNVRTLYDISSLINTIDYLPQNDIDSMINMLWGENNG